MGRDQSLWLSIPFGIFVAAYRAVGIWGLGREGYLGFFYLGFLQGL